MALPNKPLRVSEPYPGQPGGGPETRQRWLSNVTKHNTKAHTDLRAAWSKIGSPELAAELLLSAIEDAKGRKYVIVDKRSGAVHESVEKDWTALLGLLPYIARKMPETHELLPLGGMSPAEVEEKWRIREANQARAAQTPTDPGAPPPP